VADWIAEWYKGLPVGDVAPATTPRPYPQEPDNSSPWRQPRLGDIRIASDDGVGEILTDMADIDQCIRIILSTPKGTDPYRPDFALDLLDYIDWPINKATPYIVRESMKAVLTWEPRIEVTKIGVRPEAQYGRSYVQVHWRLKDPPRQAMQQITEVLFGQAYM